MKRTFTLTIILILGLISSQILPFGFGPIPSWLNITREFFTMFFLAFIMIEVGREFNIDLKNKKQYGMDYIIAATAAAFPWIFVTTYFILFLLPETTATGNSGWMEALVAGRFAAPTSAGVLFSMLAAAGLAGTWAYKKTRILGCVLN